MKVVLIEDDKNFRNTAQEIFRRNFRHLRRQEDVLEGGLWPESDRLLKRFCPAFGEKTIITVDANLNFSDEPDAIIGNGFLLVGNWLNDLLSRAKKDGDQELIVHLKENVSIVALPACTHKEMERLETFRYLKGVAEANSVPFFALSKQDGVEKLVETIEWFVKRGGMVEGGRPKGPERR